mgnify:CR=1 FL=1
MNYIPHKGDFVVLTFDPQSGHEQKGRRPAIVCPIINANRNFPFHVKVPKTSSLSGFIMAEQVKSVDF